LYITLFTPKFYNITRKGKH